MIASTIALSEETSIDFSLYTIDELVAIRDVINEELRGRIGYDNTDMIYRGKYVAGEHIIPGDYLFLCTEALSLNDRYRGKISIRELDEDGKYSIVEQYTYIEVGRGVFISIKEGMTLEIENCSGTLTEYHQSWSLDK